jgi:Tol biopolymer transport system component
MTDSRRDSGVRKLFSMGVGDYRDVIQHNATDASFGHVYNGAVSPDGTQIISVIERGPFSALGIQAFGVQQTYPNQISPFDSNCIYQSPSWLPDGSGLVYAASCNGKFALYIADLRYDAPATDTFVAASLTNIRPLTNTPNADNYFPRVSPDGGRVVFGSNREGQSEIYMINIDGSGERRLTSDRADDGAASWSPGGNQIIFDSNRDGDYEIYKLDLNNMGFVTQLTNNGVDDRWPLWYQ